MIFMQMFLSVQIFSEGGEGREMAEWLLGRTGGHVGQLLMPIYACARGKVLAVLIGY